MNVGFDATWIANQYSDKYMSGPLRVAVEFAKRFKDHPGMKFYVTTSDYSRVAVENLKRFFVKYPSQNAYVVGNTIPLVNRKIVANNVNRLRARLVLDKVYPHIPRKHLNNLDAYHSPVDVLPGFVCSRKSIKTFFTALDLIPLVIPEKTNLFFDFTRNLYDNLSSDTNVLAISQSTKNDVLSYRSDINPDKIRVIHLAADKSVFFPIKEGRKEVLQKYGIGNVSYILSVNSFAKYKNVDFVIRCFLKYKRESCNAHKLVLIGKARESSYREGLLRTYGDLGDIVFLDHICDEDMSVVYGNATVFVYMSLYEGFGLPILEAMQCGVPVISSNTSSMPEVGGDAVLYNDPEDENAFIQNLKYVVEDVALQKRLSEKSLRQSSKFSWDKYTKEVVEAYYEM